MESLPKIVRDRMQASRSAGHPDPDLLTAFAEKTLSSRERLQVMDHLAACAECREVLSLAVPESEVVPVRPAPVKAGSWLRWPVLRWGALAACVVIIGAAVSLYRSPQSYRGYVDLQKDERATPPPQAAPQSAQVQEAERAPAAPKGETRLQAALEQPQKAAVPKALAEDKKYSAGSGGGYGMVGGVVSSTQPAPAAVPPARARTDSFYFADNRKEALPTPAAPPTVLNAPAQTAESVMVTPVPPQPAKTAKQETGGGVGANVGAVSETVEVTSAAPAVNTGQADLNAPAQQAQLAKVIGAQPAKSTDQQKQEDKEAGTKAESYSQIVEVTGGAVAVETDNSQAELRKQKAEAKKDLPVTGRNIVQLQAAQPQFTPKPLTQTADSTVGGPKMLDAIQSAKWTLSDDGLPQRSLDSGKTWEKVQVDHTTAFRALSALGLEVWVGGRGGLLYHSNDIGLHWTRVTPVAGGVTLAADIIRIDFTDPLHGKLTTADHHTWFTFDGGKTWQKN
jgi:hypothetical protein